MKIIINKFINNMIYVLLNNKGEVILNKDDLDRLTRFYYPYLKEFFSDNNNLKMINKRLEEKSTSETSAMVA